MFFSPDPTPVLPTLNGFSIKKKPIFASLVQQAVSGRETRSVVQAFPLWEFELTYEILRSQTQNIDIYLDNAPFIDLERIQWVYLACGGRYGRFYYDDLSDNSRTGQVIGTGDGAALSFRMIRTWGYGALAGIEPVGAVNPNIPMVVYINGTPVADSDWLIESDGQTLTFILPPSTYEITADFGFYYRCQFLDDTQDFEQFVYNKWLLKGLKFRTVKDSDLTTPNPYVLTEAGFP